MEPTCLRSGTLVVNFDGADGACLRSGTLEVCFDGGAAPGFGGVGDWFSWSLMRLGIFGNELPATNKTNYRGGVKPPDREFFKRFSSLKPQARACNRHAGLEVRACSTIIRWQQILAGGGIIRMWGCRGCFMNAQSRNQLRSQSLWC